MKQFTILLLSLCWGSATALGQSGGPWTLRTSTTDSGSGISTGGVWTINGTMGQPDASNYGTGVWKVAGGYWPQVIGTPGSPSLTITVTAGGNFLINWTAAAVGYKLQSSANCLVWTDTGLSPTGAGNMPWSLISGPRYYFRLKKLP